MEGLVNQYAQGDCMGIIQQENVLHVILIVQLALDLIILNACNVLRPISFPQCINVKAVIANVVNVMGIIIQIALPA